MYLQLVHRGSEMKCVCCSSSKMYKNTTWKRTLRKTNAAEMMVFVCGRVFHLRVFDCVFAFLQLGDVQL